MKTTGRVSICSLAIATAACAVLPTPGFAASTTYSVNGVGNNTAHPTWGSTNVDLLRKSKAAYRNGRSTPAGTTRQSARAISNSLSAQTGTMLNDRNLSGLIYVFGQFLDHDLSQTVTGKSESFPIAVPTGDPYFDPTSTGTKTIGMSRSTFNPSTGTSTSNPRQQRNAVTALLDGSQIYGSNAVRAKALRTMKFGLLKTSSGGKLLPRNTAGLPNDNDAHIVPNSQLFLAGDVRANENANLTAMQTLFVREHNRLAASIRVGNPRLTDEQIYQQARSIVVGELQAITYNEFLPALLGTGVMPGYGGYNAAVNPGVTTEFSSAAFRFGHSTLNSEVGRMNDDETTIPQGNLELREAFFNPTVFDLSLPNHQGDIDPFLKSVASENAQEIDLKVIDDVRNFLFGPPGSGGFDLVALNIQRGRDHGLPDYNTVRAAYGLSKVTSFNQITSDPTLRAKLAATYASVNDIDVWTGGLAEDHRAGASVGPLFSKIIVDQFTRVRSGDRLFYERSLPTGLRDRVRATTLRQVILRNTSLTKLHRDVFFWRPRR